jgi:hypothetical protein
MTAVISAREMPSARSFATAPIARQVAHTELP